MRRRCIDFWSVMVVRSRGGQGRLGPRRASVFFAQATSESEMKEITGHQGRGCQYRSALRSGANDVKRETGRVPFSSRAPHSLLSFFFAHRKADRAFLTDALDLIRQLCSRAGFFSGGVRA